MLTDNKHFSYLKRLKEHPVISRRRTFSQKAADKLTESMGSWIFIFLFLLFILIWMLGNVYFLVEYLKKEPFDPFPFILLNLILSTLAAIQAPIILMSQNREAQKDRIRAEYDYTVNRKAEKEIEHMQSHLDRIEKKFDNILKQP